MNTSKIRRTGSGLMGRYFPKFPQIEFGRGNFDLYLEKIGYSNQSSVTYGFIALYLFPFWQCISSSEKIAGIKISKTKSYKIISLLCILGEIYSAPEKPKGFGSKSKNISGPIIDLQKNFTVITDKLDFLVSQLASISESLGSNAFQELLTAAIHLSEAKKLFENEEFEYRRSAPYREKIALHSLAEILGRNESLCLIEYFISDLKISKKIKLNSKVNNIRDRLRKKFRS